MTKREVLRIVATALREAKAMEPGTTNGEFSGGAECLASHIRVALEQHKPPRKAQRPKARRCTQCGAPEKTDGIVTNLSRLCPRCIGITVQHAERSTPEEHKKIRKAIRRYLSRRHP